MAPQRSPRLLPIPPRLAIERVALAPEFPPLRPPIYVTHPPTGGRAHLFGVATSSGLPPLPHCRRRTERPVAVLLSHQSCKFNTTAPRSRNYTVIARNGSLPTQAETSRYGQGVSPFRLPAFPYSFKSSAGARLSLGLLLGSTTEGARPSRGLDHRARPAATVDRLQLRCLQRSTFRAGRDFSRAFRSRVEGLLAIFADCRGRSAAARLPAP